MLADRIDTARPGKWARGRRPAGRSLRARDEVGQDAGVTTTDLIGRAQAGDGDAFRGRMVATVTSGVTPSLIPSSDWP
jgi:hypothetical protein